MKLKAEITPLSSIVGGGLSLLNGAGAVQFLGMFCGTTNGITREQADKLTPKDGGG